MTMKYERIQILAVFVAITPAIATLPPHSARGAECKEDPIEVNQCAVQKPNEVAVQDRTIRMWQTAAGLKYGRGWSSWSNAKGRIRCQPEGARTCCQAAAVPCRQ